MFLFRVVLNARQIKNNKVKSNFENGEATSGRDMKSSDSQVVDISFEHVDNETVIPIKSAAGKNMSHNSTSTMVILIQMIFYYVFNVLG